MNPDLYEAHLETNNKANIETREQVQINKLQARMDQVEFELAFLRHFLSIED